MMGPSNHQSQSAQDSGPSHTKQILSEYRPTLLLRQVVHVSHREAVWACRGLRVGGWNAMPPQGGESDDDDKWEGWQGQGGVQASKPKTRRLLGARGIHFPQPPAYSLCCRRRGCCCCSRWPPAPSRGPRCSCGGAAIEGSGGEGIGSTRQPPSAATAALPLLFWGVAAAPAAAGAGGARRVTGMPAVARLNVAAAGSTTTALFHVLLLLPHGP